MLSGKFHKIKATRYNAKKPDIGDVKASLEYYYQDYLAADKDYKAYAVAVDGKSWQTGFARKRLSQEYANRKALRRCEQGASQRKTLNNPCQLYAVGNKKVFGMDKDEIKQITKNSEQKKLGPLDKYIAAYKRSKSPKTLAISVDRQHRWTSFYLYDEDCQDMEACKKEVLKKCDKFRERWNTSTPLNALPRSNL